MLDQPRDFTLRFAVSGHPFYAANTSDLSIHMETPPPVSMTSYVIDTGYDAETTYLGQVRNLSVSTSEIPVPEGKQLIVSLGYTCNGVIVTDRLFFGQSTLTFEAGEREQFIMVAATGTCANGSVVITSRSGSAQYYYLNGNAHQVNILNRKTAAVKVTNRVYGGFLNTTNLILSISAWPLRDQGVNLAWTNPLPQVLPDVPATGYLEFKQSTAGAALVVSNQRGAASVASVTNVQLTLSLSGSAQSEYFLNQSNVIITVYPVNNVTISTVLVSQPSIFVTENVTIRVSLPEAPINSGGTVPVTPKFDNGSPSAVQITPASAVLSASNMFVDFVFLAKDVTVGNERITFTFASSGTAQNYYPQPAAPSWPVQFKPLGRVTIGTVPSEVFQGVTSTIDVTVSYIPPTGYQNIVVSLASSFTANLIVVSPGSVTWVAGDMSQSLTKQLLVKGNVPTNFVQLTFSLTTKPTIFLSTLNVVTAAVTVKDGRSIIIKPPTFLYLNGKSTTGRVELIKLPTVGTSLDLYYTPNTSAVTVDIQPKPIRFTPSSSLAQDISFTAVAVAPSVTITFTRANDLEMYDTPPPIQIQVRALEKIIVTGLPASIYVGSSVTITVVITRLPQCANSYLTVRPSFQTTDASFAPSSKTWTSGGDPNQLSSTFVLTAASTTANAVAVTFAIESDCRDIYEASVTSTVTAVKVLPKEQVTVSVPDNATDTTGAFIYQTASVPLTVSLGAPVLPHNGVRVRLAYTGAAGSVVFTPSVVDFPAGSTVYSVIVDMRGVSISSTNALTAVIENTTSYVLNSQVALPQVRVLPRIQLRLNWDPTTALLVANTTRSVTFDVLSASALAGTVTVSFVYGSEAEVTPAPFSIEARTPQRTIALNLNGLSASASKNLRVELSGPASTSYVLTQSLFPSPVFKQRWVVVKKSYSFVYIGADNSRKIIVGLDTLPTLSNDAITVKFTNSPSLKFSPAVVTLSATTTSAEVTIEGLLSGDTELADYIAVLSTSKEYAARVLFDFSQAPTKVNVRNRLKATLQDFIGTIYAESFIQFNISIPVVPQEEALYITPVLAQAGYALVSTPATIVFNMWSGLQQTVILTAPSTVLPNTPIRFLATGSPEYESIVVESAVQVILQNQVGFAGWPVSIYPGTLNRQYFTVSVSRLPNPNETLTIRPTSASNTSKLSFSPEQAVFNSSSDRAATFAIIAADIGYGTRLETVQFAKYDTMNFYQDLADQTITVQAYENLTATIDNGGVIYVDESLNVDITMTKAATYDATVFMSLKKNATGASRTMVDVTSAEAFVSASSIYVTGLSTARFSIRAVAAPLSALVNFTLVGGSRLQTKYLDSFLVRFVPLRTITVMVPEVMYLGLENSIAVEVQRIPESGTIVVNAMPSTILNASTTSFQWDSTSTVRRLSFSLYPRNVGTADVRFSLQGGARGFEQSLRPSDVITTLVKEPATISLEGLPAATFIGELNAFRLRAVLSEPLKTGEQVFVSLRTNVSLSVSPTAEQDLSLGTAQWLVYRDGTPTAASFTVDFRTTMNRWVLHASLRGAGLTTSFRPLKKITVTPPAPTYIVDETFSFAVTLEEAPQPGANLHAKLSYAGSPDNVYLPPLALWDSTTSLTKTLTARGRSPTSSEALSVVFLDDPSYDLTPYVHYVSFDPLFTLRSVAPLSLFVNRTGQLIVYNADGKLVDVTPTAKPSDALSFDPAVLSFTADSSGKAPTQLAFTVTANRIVSSIEVSYALSGGDSSKFNPLPSDTVKVVDNSEIRIDAPATSMTAYLGTRGLDVTVELARLPNAQVNVTPSFGDCGNGFAALSVSTLRYKPTSSPRITFTIMPVRTNAYCVLSFYVSQTEADTFSSGSSLYRVQVRPPHNISLTKVPTRLFPGEENRAPVEVSLDSDTPLPLDSMINVTFVSLNPSCLVVSPLMLLWAAGNDKEPRTKAVFISETPVGECIKDGVGVAIFVSTASRIFRINLPSAFYLDIKPLLKVAVKEPSFTSNDYYVFKGDSSLSFSVTLPEALLLESEELSVSANYGEYQSKIITNAAMWKGPRSSLTQYIVLEGAQQAPHATLEFVVAGPPRFEKKATGGGFLEVFGPLQVTADVPRTMLAGRTYTFRVTVQDRPFPGETLYIRPLWEGRNQSMLITPSELQWQSNTMTLQQTMTINTLEVSGAYMFTLAVSGTTRFEQTAFRDTVEILSPQVITTRGIPIQLMVGQTYSLVVDVGELPEGIYDKLTIIIAPQKFNSIDCVTLSTSQLEFSSHDALAPTSMEVDVKVLRECPMREIRFSVTGNASLAYNRSVVPRTFIAVPALAIEVAWPLQAYVGPPNQPEAFFTLRQELTVGTAMNISIYAMCTAGNTSVYGALDAVQYPVLVQYSSDDAAEKAVPLVGILPGVCTFTFTMTTTDPNYPAVNIPQASTTFFPLISISRMDNFTETIYAEQSNQALMIVQLSEALRQPLIEQPKKIRLIPVADDSAIVFQPAVVEWLPGQAETAKIYIWSHRVLSLAHISFTVGGTGATVVSDIPLPLTLSVVNLLVIDFTRAPSELFVGPANAMPIYVTAPNGTAVNVTVIVDGERTAIMTTPSVLTWSLNSPRTQRFWVEGVYGTEVRCRLRYLVSGPPYVKMAEGSALQQIYVRSLLTVTRTPADTRIVAPEQSSQLLTFEPTTVSVVCEAFPNTTYITFNPQTNVSTIRRVDAGLVQVTCNVSDPTYAPPALFLVEATKKKVITIQPNVDAFVGIETTLMVSLSERPKLQNLKYAFSDTLYFRFVPRDVTFFTDEGAPINQVVKVVGRNVTSGAITVRPTGVITDEYREPSFFGTYVTVRNRLVLSVERIKTATKVFETGGNNFTAYVSSGTARNGARFDLILSGPPLTGPVRITPETSNAKVKFTPQSVIFFPKAESLRATVEFFCSEPLENALIWLTTTGPAEFVSGRADVGLYRFRTLETITVSQALQPVLFTGTLNVQKLGVTISGYPGPGQSVEISAEIDSALSVTPGTLHYTPEEGEAGKPPTALTQYFQVIGKTPQAVAKIVLSSLVRSTSATNFDNTITPNTVSTRVSDVFTFGVYNPKTFNEVKSVEFFNSEGRRENGAFFRVAVEGLPISGRTADISIDPSDPSLVVIDPPFVQFRQSSPVNYIDVAVYGRNATAQNLTLTFTLTGPPEFLQNQRVRVKLGILAKLSFLAREVPDIFAVGISNAKTFYVKPAQSGLHVTALPIASTGCESISFSETDSLEWAGEDGWRRVTVIAEGPTKVPCQLYLQNGADGLDRSKFVDKPFQLTMMAYPAPKIVAVVQPEITVAQMKRGYEVQLVVVGHESFIFNEQQKFGFGSANATIEVDSSDSSSSLPAGLVARYMANPDFVRVKQYSADYRTITLVLGDDQYAATKREMITIVARPSAIKGNIVPTTSSTSFTVQGQQDNLVGATEASVISNGANAAVIAGGSMSLGAATQGGKLETIMKAYNCPNPDWKYEQEEMEWYELLIPLKFGSIEDLGVYAAVGSANVVLVCLFTMLHLGVAAIVYLYRQNGPYYDKSFSCARALVRFPSFCLFPVLIFYQGVVADSLRVVLYSPVAGLRMLGAAALILFGMGVPGFIFTRVGPGFQAKWVAEVDDNNKPVNIFTRARKIIQQTGKWENPEQYLWCLRFGMFFDEFRKGFHWWLFFDVFTVLTLAVIQAIVPTTREACKIQMLCNVAVFAIQLIVTTVVRPYRVPLSNGFFILAYILQFFSMLLITIAYFQQTPAWEGVGISTQCLIFFSALLMVKSIVDAVMAFKEFTGIERILEAEKRHTFEPLTAEAEEAQQAEMTAALSTSMKETMQERSSAAAVAAAAVASGSLARSQASPQGRFAKDEVVDEFEEVSQEADLLPSGRRRLTFEEMDQKALAIERARQARLNAGLPANYSPPTRAKSGPGSVRSMTRKESSPVLEAPRRGRDDDDLRSMRSIRSSSTRMAQRRPEFGDADAFDDL
jgi:hypothetical protein